MSNKKKGNVMSLLYSFLQGAVVSAINQQIQSRINARYLQHNTKKTGTKPFSGETSKKDGMPELNDGYIYLSDYGGVMKK